MDIKELLGKIAPTVASAVLGPAGGMAVSAIGSILGVSDATQENLTEVIKKGQLTSDQIAGLQELELKYKNEEKERGFKYRDLEFQNLKSARDMQIATKSWVPGALSVGVTVGFFSILVFLLVDEYQPSEPLLIMLGSLGTAWTAIVNFWFGSSHGSTAKTELLARTDAIK